MTKSKHLAVALLGLGTAIAALEVPQLLAQQGGGRGGPPPALMPSYTTAQADAGKAAYAQNCATCHGANVDDGEFAPPLRGAGFMGKYAGKTAGDIFSYITTKMPPANPGSLGAPVNAEILAYIFQQNGLPSGEALPSDAAQLASLKLPGTPGRGGAGGPGGGLSTGVKLPPAPKTANPLDKITPVTDAMLANPGQSDWLTWRRSFDDQGFSPLKQITKSNVSNLHVAWTWALPPGANEATPLIHDGVMFVHGPGDKLEALNAANGDLLWEYSRTLPPGVNASVKRNISIYGNKVYMSTSDIHVVALDVKTGKTVWDMPLAKGDLKGFTETGGPLVAKGKVMVGTGGRVPGTNYIVAFDAETGKEAWRFNTIAQEGEPGGDTWNGHPNAERNGASVWVAGSYDAQLNLSFWGVAQTYDTKVLANPKPGSKNDGLYTDSTLAINPDTGKLVWYYQHLPNDQWDLDWVFERQIVRMPVNGVVRPLVMTSGKQAIYDVLDAETGKYVYSKDLGLQNEVSAIDPVTGKKTINPDTLPGNGKAVMACPHAGGAKSWIPGSYNPDTKILYVPLVESCMDLTPVEEGGRGSLSTGVRWTLRPRPDSDGKYGRVEAINILTREVVWTSRQRAPESSGALATAGGVVFAGGIDRYFRAYDDQTGKQLWEVRLSDVPSNAPITYSVNGKQYLAIGVGNGGAQAMTFPALVPEIKNTDRAPGIWVFELP